MVKKFNLSEAAADILNKSIASAKKGTEGPSKLPTSVVAGQKDVGEIGTQVTKTTDGGPDASKGVASATPPGATPPVGSEPMKKLKGQPAESGSVEHPEGKPGRQMMQQNPGATFQQYEEFELEEERLDELSVNKMSQYSDAAEKDRKRLNAKWDAGTASRKEQEKAIGREEGENRAANKIKNKTGKYPWQLAKEDMEEDIDALLQGQDLSEEFVSKATTIFEAAVMSRVEEIAEEVESQLHEQFEQAVEELKEDFANKIDDYLNYMVEEWMEENQLAIESGLRAEIVEDFIGGLRNLFAEHYIDIPEEKVDVVEEMASKVEELEGKLNEEIQKSIEFRKEINEHKKIQAIQAVCEGLTQTQVEKLKSLAESVEFTSEEDFAEKINTLKEAYAHSNVKPAEKSALEEGVEVPEDKPGKTSADPLINAVVNSISKSVQK
jgi:hypothetical protein